MFALQTLCCLTYTVRRVRHCPTLEQLAQYSVFATVGHTLAIAWERPKSCHCRCLLRAHWLTPSLGWEPLAFV